MEVSMERAIYAGLENFQRFLSTLSDQCLVFVAVRSLLPARVADSLFTCINRTIWPLQWQRQYFPLSAVLSSFVLCPLYLVGCLR